MLLSLEASCTEERFACLVGVVGADIYAENPGVSSLSRSLLSKLGSGRFLYFLHAVCIVIAALQ